MSHTFLNTNNEYSNTPFFSCSRTSLRFLLRLLFNCTQLEMRNKLNMCSNLNIFQESVAIFLLVTILSWPLSSYSSQWCGNTTNYKVRIMESLLVTWIKSFSGDFQLMQIKRNLAVRFRDPKTWKFRVTSLSFSHLDMSDSSWPHGPEHARHSYLPLPPGVVSVDMILVFFDVRVTKAF